MYLQNLFFQGTRKTLTVIDALSSAVFPTTTGATEIFPWPWQERKQSLWLNDSAMILFRLQVVENKDHWPFNTPAARLAASATLSFVVGGEKATTACEQGGGKKKRQRDGQREKREKSVWRRQSDRKMVIIESSTVLGRTFQSVTPFWLGSVHHSTWLWPAFSHLGSLCLSSPRI